MTKKTFFHSFLLLIFIAILVQSVYNLTLVFSEKTSDKNKLFYSQKSSIDYTVDLLKNDFLETEIMPAGKTYISKLVEKINFKYNYSFNSKEALDIENTHEIIATLTGEFNENPTSNNNPIIWEKSYPIKTKEFKKNETASNVIIEESFEVVLTEFNKEASSFLTEFEIPTVVYLEIKMPVKIKGASDKYKLDEKHEVVARIPLLTKVMQIDAELLKKDDRSIASFIDSKNDVNERKAIVYSVMLAMSLFLIAATIRKLPFFYNEETYKDFIEELKKEYDDIIVETNNMIDIKGLKPIMITSFKELVNLAQSLETPIILFEKKNFACFYITNASIIYMYLVKDDHMELKELFKN